MRKVKRRAGRWLRHIVRNPIFIVVVIVAVLLMGWNSYLKASRDLDMPVDNMLAGGEFDATTNGGIPHGWRTTYSGALQLTSAPAAGYVSGKSLRLQIAHYQNGDAELLSPRVSLATNRKYFFKGFYKASAGMDLLARYYYADGTSQLRLVRNYPSNADAWSTVSTALTTGGAIRSVQFVYRLSGNGFVQLDATFLEEKNDVSIPAEASTIKNLFHNANARTVTDEKPQAWLTYHAGKNQPQFAYRTREGKSYLQVTVRGYKNGEAKWQQAPIAVRGGQYFQFGVNYQSNTTSEVIVEYVLKNGKRQFDTVATLNPASEWTYVQAKFEVPANAKSMFTSVVLRANGSLSTTDYVLSDITKLGATQWKRPLVSLTFDDGWESTYQNGVPILRRYGYNGTFYVNPSSIDTRNFMSTAQLKTLQHGGDELASHGYDHIDMTTVNSGRLDAELKGSRDFLQQTFGLKSQDFATPFGNTDAEVQTRLHAYYRSHRTTFSGINTKQNFDPYQLSVLYIGETTPLKTLQEELAQARGYQGWLIIVYHQVTTHKMSDGKEGGTITPAHFSEQMQAIKRSDLAVKTVAGALDEITAQSR